MASMLGNRFARVVKVHPEANAVDLLFLDDGSHLPLVQVQSGAASTNSGLADLTQPDLLDQQDPYKQQDTGTRDIYAIVGYVGRIPFVSGFLFPQVCQMLFKDIGRRINRHCSDVYTNLTAAGDFEFYHPSGTFLRIGVANSHEDLTGQDFDKKWKITKNLTQHVHVHLEVQKEGVNKATVDIDPDGNIAITNVGTLHTTTTGAVTIETSASATIKATSGTVTVDTPTAHFTGDVNVDGTVTATTDVVGGGKHLKTHTHGGVSTGTGHTAAPD